MMWHAKSVDSGMGRKGNRSMDPYKVPLPSITFPQNTVFSPFLKEEVGLPLRNDFQIPVPLHKFVFPINGCQDSILY